MFLLHTVRTNQYSVTHIFRDSFSFLFFGGRFWGLEKWEKGLFSDSSSSRLLGLSLWMPHINSYPEEMLSRIWTVYTYMSTSLVPITVNGSFWDCFSTFCFLLWHFRTISNAFSFHFSWNFVVENCYFSITVFYPSAMCTDDRVPPKVLNLFVTNPPIARQVEVLSVIKFSVVMSPPIFYFSSNNKWCLNGWTRPEKGGPLPFHGNK